MFLRAEIGGITVSCLIDTGSSLSTIHPALYNRMTEKPLLSESDVRLRMADGSLVPVCGEASFSVQIQGVSYTQTMAVAEIETPVVLGYDFMCEHHCQINVPKGQIILKGNLVKCIYESTLPSIFRIQVAENVTVPRATEMIIPAKIEGCTPHITKGIIEAEGQAYKNGLLVAKTVIDPCLDFVPLRVLNVSGKEQVLYANTHIATCHPVSDVREMNRERESEGSETLPEYLKPAWENAQENLTSEQAVQVKTLLMKHKDVFAKNKTDLGRTDIVKHKINTGTAAPVKQNPRRLPLSKRELVREEISKMLEQGIVQPSQSPWSSPVVLVQKKDGSTRFCVDYRKLNNLTLKDSYPLPRIDESLDALRGSKWFSTLDLQSGYFQVEMDPADAEKTAFTTICGLYQFKVMSFGLCNAPATFERMMEIILSGLHWETCLLYIDDVIIFADSFEQHLERLSEVLSRLQTAGLKLSPKKCQLFKKKVCFLGHVVSEHGISTDPAKIRAVEQWSAPTDVHQVRSFLGLCSYYRRFVEGFATIARPLHKLTEKKNPFRWTPECQESFMRLKQALCSSPILCYPTIRQNFVLDTDASGVGIGAVLSQVEDGKERVVAYYSRALNKAERNYCITRKELLAVVEAVKHFHHYIYGVETVVRTDHGALTWLISFKNIEGQMARWLETLGAYDLKIRHRTGRKHMNADGLSRLPCDNCDYCSKREVRDQTIQLEDPKTGPSVRVLTRSQSTKCNEDASSLTDNNADWLPADNDKIRMAQSQDEEISLVHHWLVQDRRPDWKDISHLSTSIKHYWALWDSLILQNGLVYRRKFHDTAGVETYLLLVPKSLRKEVMKLLHNNITAGHLGVTRTVTRIKDRFDWPSLREDVENWCRACTECQRAKNVTRKPRAKLRVSKVGAPMERVGIDILGPMTQTRRGYRYVLVISDYFTRWTEAFAMKNIEAVTVADLLVKEFICRYGIPRQIHSDQGRQFESEVFQQMCLLFDIDKTRSTAYHPQSNGLVERFNRTLLNMLTKFVSSDQRDWDQKLPFLMLAYRSSEHESTGYSPNKMMLGRETELPADLLYGPPPENRQDECQYITDMKEHLENVHSLAREKMLKASDRQKRTYDHRANQHSYSDGDLVWLQTKRKRSLAPKLQFGWEGPYRVVQKLTDLVYRIQRGPQSATKVVHHNLVKPYIGYV